MAYSQNNFWLDWQDAGWQGAGLQGANELGLDNDDEVFKYVDLDPDQSLVYPHVPSTFDDQSTILGSDLGTPALTFGQTQTPSSRSRASKASPSLGLPEEPDLYYGLGSPRLHEGGNGLGLSLEDNLSSLRHIGANPEIQVQESLSSPPKQICLDDAAIGLSPRSPLMSAGSPSPSSAGASMKRGRSNPLPADKRAKVSTMRKKKACSWCRIHKVECAEVEPCDHCRKNYPGYPEEACDRAKLSETRFPDYYQPKSIWLHSPHGAIPYRDPWQPTGFQANTTMILGQALEESSGMAQTLQSYVASSSRFPLLSPGYYPPYLPAGLSAVSSSSASNWPGSFPYQRAPASLVPNEPRLTRDGLLARAEEHLSMELQRDKGRSFPAAVGAILLADRDSSLGASGPQSASGKKKQAAVNNIKDLVRRVIDMQCWLRVWQSPAVYCRAQERQLLGAALPSSAANISELRRTAITKLIACEKDILKELDELPFRLNREIQLPIWACLWQMIFTYRDLIKTYAGTDHGLASSSLSASLGFNTVLEDTPIIVERLHRLLVIKYAAYISSSSPVFHKSGQEDIRGLLSGDKRLKNEWENVLLQREEFCKHKSPSHANPTATNSPMPQLLGTGGYPEEVLITNGPDRTYPGSLPSDAFLKALIIDKEANMERKRKRKRSEQTT